MTFPSNNFGGVPSQYQGHLTWVPAPQYQGGGYYAAYGRGRKFSFAEMETLWNDAGGDPKLAGLMAAIGENESGGYVGDWNSTGATSIWEIEYPGSAPPGISREQLFGAAENAQAAVRLSGNTLSGIQSNWRGDPALAPGYQIPNIPPAKHVSGAGSPTNSGNANPKQGGGFPFSNFFANLFSNPVDALERLGLIIFGAILLVIGLYIIGSGPARAVGRDFGLLAPKKGRGQPVLTPEEQADKERRMQLAERSASIGQRRVAVAESREERIGRKFRTHGGRTGGREPNPEPVHQ